MSESSSRSDVRLDVGDDYAPARTVEPDTPFRVLVLADFSGRANRGFRAPLAGRRPIQVDVDNLDEVIARLGTSLNLPRAALRFQALEDFHPDRIYARTSLFRQLEEMRDQPPRPAAVPAAATPVASGNLLDAVLGEEERSSTAGDAGDLQAFLDRVTRPYLMERPDPNRQAWSAHIDQTAAGEMREILHHPDFQALEAAWRAVWMLVQRLEADNQLKVYLLDATLAELVSDPAALDQLAAPAEPWGAIVGNFSFTQTAGDAARLALFGKMARRAGAPFLAEALPPEDDGSAEWQALRHSPLAAWIGLAVPRFLLRLPYGPTTDSIDAFAFDEMPESVHTGYLWGNPAFGCAYLLGLAFRADGWSLRPGSERRIENLPLHIYRDADGDSVSKPCAELLLRESDAEFLEEKGFMPLASLKNEGAALLVRFQSIADPPTRLAGQWQ